MNSIMCAYMNANTEERFKFFHLIDAMYREKHSDPGNGLYNIYASYRNKIKEVELDSKTTPS